MSKHELNLPAFIDKSEKTTRALHHLFRPVPKIANTYFDFYVYVKSSTKVDGSTHYDAVAFRFPDYSPDLFFISSFEEGNNYFRNFVRLLDQFRYRVMPPGFHHLAVPVLRYQNVIEQNKILWTKTDASFVLQTLLQRRRPRGKKRWELSVEMTLGMDGVALHQRKVALGEGHVIPKDKRNRFVPPDALDDTQSWRLEDAVVAVAHNSALTNSSYEKLRHKAYIEHKKGASGGQAETR